MSKPCLAAGAATLITLLFLAISPANSAAKPPGQDLLLLYSNDVHGETEACG